MTNLDNQLVIPVHINEGQKLSEIKQLWPLPSDAIFHKRLPGLGATYSEIIAPRHSIIILPNVPVIKSKVKKYNKEHQFHERILGVYKGITPDAIATYLDDDTVEFKKILITPESYAGKFKEVTKENWDYIKKTFYLLIDECERAIQDVDYREKITAPFDDLFSFISKGLVSATTLPFSHPRLVDFTHYVINPLYAYAKPLKLIVTNNIVALTRQYFIDIPANHYFIFTSSITLMKALIENLDIKRESKIHCSVDKAAYLKREGFKTDSDFSSKHLVKYNFFTSRFYSGLDMELPFKADIFMLTEVNFAEHSILDPETEVIQITGRFRNGVSSITHISNVNPNLKTREPEEIMPYLEGLRDIYMEILRLKRTMHGDGQQEALNDLLDKSSFGRFFYEDGSFNWFMVDNYIQEQRVLSMYKDQESLVCAYQKVHDHFILTDEFVLLPLTDSDRLKRESYESKIALFKTVVEQYERLMPQANGEFVYSFNLNEKVELQKLCPTAVEALLTIGKEAIVALNYSERNIKKAIEDYKNINKYFNQELLRDIHDKFKLTKDGERPMLPMYIETTLQDIYDRHGIAEKAEWKHLKRWFNVQDTTTTVSGNKLHTFRLLSIKPDAQLSSE